MLFSGQSKAEIRTGIPFTSKVSPSLTCVMRPSKMLPVGLSGAGAMVLVAFSVKVASDKSAS